ncbi:hypothetical protein [Verrucomicrobium spinosum]|uniref:hypothetical protein n=1 Tax=Verrucomicrobium spinosum TaxID=2736 RepID=UPI0001744BE9|nr:hypothetical protein [Verrucomicrobium spinosum]
MRTDADLNSAIDQWASSRPKCYDFPLGEGVEIPLEVEIQLARAFELHALDSAAILLLRGKLDPEQAYAFVTFAVRMSVLAVRKCEIKLIRSVLVCLILDDALVDSKDILRALGIIDDCCGRLDLDLAKEMEELSVIAVPRRRHTLIDGYFSRSPDMKGALIMGFVPAGEMGQFGYVRR